ncbi:hypothetical protein HUW51_10445 [Adhaeribacter swui]|uniref:Uncharacterized protein n=1 Tax=Adhaeribacter swui TaxID=2086471 RepID=A0A7G7G7J0_9BACT|nr:hypothetical protein [Adhaeribacter swui]QNF33124.1 hypothetical protein HUW51_10445 [Adhaeribacter swui]
MTVKKLKLNDSNLDQLVDYLIRAGKFDYEKHGADMTILVQDNLLLTDMTAHLNILILKNEAGFILADVISGGGEDGLLDFSGLVDKDYAGITARLLYDYAQLYELVIEPVKAE